MKSILTALIVMAAFQGWCAQPLTILDGRKTDIREGCGMQLLEPKDGYRSMWNYPGLFVCYTSLPLTVILITNTSDGWPESFVCPHFNLTPEDMTNAWNHNWWDEGYPIDRNVCPPPITNFVADVMIVVDTLYFAEPGAYLTLPANGCGGGDEADAICRTAYTNALLTLLEHPYATIQYTLHYPVTYEKRWAWDLPDGTHWTHVIDAWYRILTPVRLESTTNMVDWVDTGSPHSFQVAGTGTNYQVMAGWKINPTSSFTSYRTRR
jgi:hypothetical protein